METTQKIEDRGGLIRSVRRARGARSLPARKRPSRPRPAPRSGGLGWWSPHAVVGMLCVPAIGLGWLSRNEFDLSPSYGLGYLFGILGLSMMLVLLGYSLRKRSRVLRHAGSIRNWFEFHLILGLLGPTLILYHSNFSLGSANATISLACVLAVSGSGVGGRFLYGGLHRSMAGERRSVRGILARAHETLLSIQPLLAGVPDAADLMTNFERSAVGGSPGLLRSIRAVGLRIRGWLVGKRVIRLLRAANAGSDELQEARKGVQSALTDVCRAGELRLFEQLFSLWHAIHVPLTIILFVSAAIHVVAVHLY